MSTDAGKKVYVVAMVIRVIYTGMYIVSKAAFDGGMNTFVFIFYRQAAASLLLLPLAILLERRNAPPMSLWLFTKIFMYALLGNTVSMNLHNMSLKYTSATVASATSNSIPVFTFLFAVLLHFEAIKLRTAAGTAKLAGVTLCVAGVLVIALYTGPPLNPLNHHRAFAAAMAGGKQGEWMKGTFLMLLANLTWSLWIVLQARLLTEYPNKLLATTLQCLLSTAQSLALAAAVTAFGKDMSVVWRLQLDVGLVAVAYSGFVVTGVSFYLQAWCIERRGPVFLAMTNPVGLVLTMFCSSFFLGEVVHLGSVLGGALLVAGLYSVLLGKSKEQQQPPPPGLAPASAASAVKQGCYSSNARNGDKEDKIKLEEKNIKMASQV
ncbi:WAT1-related protein At5g64700 [Aegilops tauschii subsp. strangulata]|uniref:WAT1-related protein n=3 Tax=Aegilops tauschii TaxID=37682 RepID=A0A453MVD8_AEGTS|nr:WAT1-related protein At5g64700 [Aegilops tauschii subsp. strangulata]